MIRRLRSAIAGALLALPLFVLALLPLPATAQFASQATYVASSSGTNSITVVLPNFTQLADILGVPLRVKVLNGTTGGVTLNVTNVGGSPSSGAQTVQKPTTVGLAALVSGDIVAGQIYEFMWDGSVFQMRSPTLFTGTVPAQNGFTVPVNLQINCTASANALTCAMKAANTGADASTLAPIYIPFRDSTQTNGDPVWRTITGAVSFTISGGNTMGCSSGAPCRLWITAIDNGGTVLLGLSNQSITTQCFPLNEGVVQTTGSGTGGGNTAGTIFTSVSAVSAKAVRIIGYVEYTTLTTAGNWTSPNFVTLFGPGIKKPCDVIQTVYVTEATSETTTSTTYAASANARISITPTATPNLIWAEFSGSIDNGSTSNNSLTRWARGTASNTNLFGSEGIYPATGSGTNSKATAVSAGLDAPATTSSTTYTINFRVTPGPSTATLCSFQCALRLTEIQG